MLRTSKTILLYMIVLITACGTKVDVGENETPPVQNSDDAVGVEPGDSPGDSHSGSNSAGPGASGPDNTSNHSGTDQSGTKLDDSGQTGTPDSGQSNDNGSGNDQGSDNSGGGYTITCFGASPNTPRYLDQFCAEVEEPYRSTFSKAINTLCQEKVLVNLLRSSCSWDGNPDSQGSYFRVMERTNLDDTHLPNFDYYAAFSVTVNSTPEEMTDILFGGYTDPNYSDTYETVANSRVYDVTWDRSALWIEYRAELASSSATIRYRGRLDAIDFGPNLRVVFDRALDEMQLIRKSHYMTMFVDLGNGTTRVLVIDEKQIADSGNHRIANTTAVNVDLQRMHAAFVNAERD